MFRHSICSVLAVDWLSLGVRDTRRIEAEDEMATAGVREGDAREWKPRTADITLLARPGVLKAAMLTPPSSKPPGVESRNGERLVSTMCGVVGVSL